MFRKKMFLAGTAAVLAFSLSVFPAFAHGHHGGHHGNRTAVTVPDGNYNTGVAGNTDINADAGISADPDTETVPGTYPVCTFEGCTETGRHLHDGSYYCGYYHNGGYCDGSCIGSSATVSDSSAADSSPAANSPSASGYYYGRRYNCHRSYARKMVYCH